MRRWSVVLSAVALATSAATVVAGSASAGNDNDPYTLSGGHANAGPAGGVVNARGDAHAARPHGGTSGPNLIAHGGPVQHGTHVMAIYWGTSWPAIASANDKQLGLASLYQGLTGSNYAATNKEYTDSRGHVDPSVSYEGALVDNSAAPSGAPSTSTIGNEVLKVLAANHLTVQSGWYYPVYVDTRRGNAGYCAWHSAATTSTTRIEFQFGFFFNLDLDAGCDPQAPSSVNHSQGLNALASVTGHEYSEMVTDPQLNAWYDQQGNENADKCAWTFGGTETLANGSVWYIQGNWSNAAYTGGQGYSFNGRQYVGCINSATP